MSRKSTGEIFKEPVVPYDLMHSSPEAAKTDDQEDLDTDEAMEVDTRYALVGVASSIQGKLGLTYR